MSRTTMSGGWAPVATAPRDGTPVILWMIEDDAPPGSPYDSRVLDLNQP